MANTTITPNAGIILISLSVVLTPAAGALHVTNNNNAQLTPKSGQLFVTTPPPILTPGAGSLGIAGQIPTQTLTLLAPIAGAAVLAGVAPTVTISGITGVLTPAPGAIGFTGQAPMVSQTTTPGFAALALAGQQPTMVTNVIISPNAGSLAQSGLVTLLGQGSITVPGSLSINGQPPAVSVGTFLQPAPKALAFAGLPPTITINFTLTPNAGAVNAAGQAPATLIGSIATPNAGSLGVQGARPQLLTAYLVTPNPGAVQVAGQAPGTLTNVFETGAAAQMALAGQAPSLVVGRILTPAAGALRVVGGAPQVVSLFSPNPASLAITGQAPRIRIGVNASTLWPNRVITTTFYSQQLQANAGPLPYGEYFARVGDVEIYAIDWDGWLANYWERGGIVPPGLVIRSTQPNGFQYITTAGGASGNAEPVWPTNVGKSITEGSVTWTCAPMDTSSLYATVQSAVWKPPTGILIDGQSIAGQETIAVLDASAAQVGTDYPVDCFAAMSDGETKVGRIVIKVR